MPRSIKYSLIAYALISAGVITPLTAMAADQATNVGAVKISGDGDELGNGLMIQDDGTKARSTVTKAAIEKALPTSNPFQLLNLMPGVNATSADATGLFGGTLHVRGFNSDQMGVTINGAPVNDSGNFAVYPQEYTDTENLCEVFVTQGSTDTEAPHVGASGGNLGMVTCGAKDERGVRFSQSLGSLNYSKSFIRFDSGKFSDTNPFKFFVSYSHAKTDKFKGYGGAKRDHVDFGANLQISDDTSLTASLLYNRAINNNIKTLTKAAYAANPDADYSNVIPQHTGVGSEKSNFAETYYGYSINPFENYLLTSALTSRINDRLTLSAEPYFWYGYGTGGTEQSTLSVNNTFNGSKLGGGISNPYSGSTANVVGVYSGSLTETHRPGVTFKAKYNTESQKILAGLWIERAEHEQTKPAVTVDNNGNVSDIWQRNHRVRLNDGSLYQNRDYKTTTTASSLFFTDAITVTKDLEVVPGVKYLVVRREFDNHPAYGFGNGASYKINRTYNKILPSLGFTYKLDDGWQLYGNVAENMRTPANYTLSGGVASVKYKNGVPTASTLNIYNQKPEMAVNSEAGIRYFGDYINSSIALFNVNFRDRQTYGFNPETNTRTNFNVGGVLLQGFEFQAGTTPIDGWSAFTSLTFTDSEFKRNYPTALINGTPAILPIAGKQYPNTPEWMAGVSLQYADGPFIGTLSGKYTGKQYTTLMNDEYAPSYTIVDLSLGYRFQSLRFVKDPTIRFNVSNLFDKSYLMPNQGSGSSITATTVSGYKDSGHPTYYVGAPRFVSVTMSMDF